MYRNNLILRILHPIYPSRQMLPLIAKQTLRYFSIPSKLLENPNVRSATTTCKLLDKLIASKKAAPLPTEISLSQLHYIPGSLKQKKRLGRSRRAGRFCGRGNGGTKSYSGFNLPRLFEGGNFPFHRTVPKYGFKNKYRDRFINCVDLKNL